MFFYLTTILVSMIITSLFNLAFSVGNKSFLYLIVLVIILTLVEIIIDCVFATLVRWIFPKKWFSVDKKFFSASKKERIFYEKIGIKKWKDKTLDLGSVTGFKKKTLQKTTDETYFERFIIECNYGVLVHVLCDFFGFAVLFLCPNPFKLTIGLPVAIVNLFLNSLSLFILRYNLPKLRAVYNFNIKRKRVDKNVCV